MSPARGSLSRLSHAVSRLERAGWVERRSCGGAGRRTEARLTDKGWQQIRQTAPGHVREVRRLVIDALTGDAFAISAVGERAVRGFEGPVALFAVGLHRRRSR